MKARKFVFTLVCIAAFSLSLIPCAFASSEPATSGGDIAIHTDAVVHPSENWQYTAQTLDGDTLAVLQAVYHGADITVTAEGYDGTDSVYILRTDTSAAEDTSSEPTMEIDLSSLFSGDMFSGMGDSFDPMGLNSGDPDPAIVSQFERVELEDFICPNEYGEPEEAEFVCYVYVPEEAATQSLPIVFALNGVGECGSNGSNLTANRMATCWLDAAWQDEHPCIVVAPQAPVHLLSPQTIEVYPEIMSAYVDRLKTLFDEMIETYTPSRVYLTGVSMGSITSFMFLSRYPDYPINAALLCCGAALESDASTITETPILLATDAGDGTVKTADVVATYNTIVDAGNENITLLFSYMNYAHFIWEYIYDNPTYMEWLFAQ